MYYSQQPLCGSLPNAAALLAWTPGNDPINVCSVPLASRGTPAIPTRIFMNGPGYTPGFDADSQGGTNTDIFNFDYWQYVDAIACTSGTFCIPPVTWMNACHRNGVLILGGIMTYWSPSFTDFATLLADPQKAATQFAAIAQYYGFDGYMVDIETFGGSSGHVDPDKFQLFLSSLRAALQANSPSSMLIYYETINKEGAVDRYFDMLCAENQRYFQDGSTVVSDGFFCNYGWGTQQIDTTLSTAKSLDRSSLDVYMGVGVGSVQLDSWSYVQSCVQNNLSTALWGADWPFAARTDEQTFQSLQQQFWGTGKNPQGCMAAVLSPRPVPSALPFCTTFNEGMGRSFYWPLHGTQAYGGSDWNNLSLQDVVMTYRNSVWSTSGNADAFTLDVSYDNALDGGSSLLLAAGSDAASGAFSIFDLYLTEWSLSNGMQVAYTLQPPPPAETPSTTADLALGFLLDDADQTLLLLAPSPSTSFSSLAIGSYNVVVVEPSSVTTIQPISQSSSPTPWSMRSYDFPSTYSGNNVVEVLAVAVVLGENTLPAGSPQLYVGQIVVTESDSLTTAPSSVTNFAIESQWSTSPFGYANVNLELSWTAPSTGTVRAYDVSYTANGQQVWLGRTTGTMFWVGQFSYTVPDGGSTDMQFQVQVIGGNGIEQITTDAASVAFSYVPPS